MLKIIKDQDSINKILYANDFSNKTLNDSINTIIETVKRIQDKALYAYTEKFDGVRLNTLKVSESEIKESYNLVSKTFIDDLKLAKQNIETYHQKEMIESFEIRKDNSFIGQRVSAIEKVALYVPGGKASYPSSVLMNAIPAKTAGVNELIILTPPQKDGTIKAEILVAADLCGIKNIYKVGGAQAIAAAAYGTETIPAVDKVVGPGNSYVALAKKALDGVIGIDMVAGPSEVAILADGMSNPDYIAMDLMSQAEHDEEARAILFTDSLQLAEAVNTSLNVLIKTMDRSEIIEQALTNHGAVILSKDITEAIEYINTMAPEHCEIMTENALDDSYKIKQAGAIFIGAYTPEAVGDYFAGTNHTLPTSRTARFSSGLSTLDFIKKTSVVYYDRETLIKNADSIYNLAQTEGLQAHAESVNIRRK